MNAHVPTYDTADRGGFGPDPRDDPGYRRHPAGPDRVLVAVMLAPDQQDPSSPDGMTHLAVNELATALESRGFELGGRPGDPGVYPYATVGDALGAVYAARGLAVRQRDELREALAGLVDATSRVAAAAADRADLGESGAYEALERAADTANRVLLDLPHANRDADLRAAIAAAFRPDSCGRVDRHDKHVHGPLTDPRLCHGHGGFD